MGIRALPGFHFCHGMAGTDELIFIGGKPFKPHRTAGVDLAGGDSDLSPESVNKTVGKAGRNIPVHPGTVHKLHKDGGVILAVGADTVGMMGTVCINMTHSF